MQNQVGSTKINPSNGQVRQGDVLIERVSSIPSGLKETKPVFALGEATGHHHRMEGKHVTGFYKEGDTGEPISGGTPLAQFAEIVGVPAPLVHEEHGPIWREPGRDQKTPQREYHPAAIRSVVD